ncbi:hypothetical protein [Terrabacter sp. Root181]|uniref:hypothetical protein n=1 Tax=Terrabacter sp. Root181 TaxID=1736484 RepID=UPI0006F7951B|nr:hypothetical protein [Terrabacter sp. Root181]KRB47041.1 hypothetical protein ASD90_01245 [Terrabacter sp. Root181]
MSALRHRLSSDVGALPAVAASLAATVVVLLGTVTGAGAGQALVTAATVGVLAVVLATTAVRMVRPLPVRVHASGVPGAVPASTAYWCALDAPRCPQRPRAPGRH